MFERVAVTSKMPLFDDRLHAYDRRYDRTGKECDPEGDRHFAQPGSAASALFAAAMAALELVSHGPAPTAFFTAASA